MAVLITMTYGTYTNANAVPNVINYALRDRKNETRKNELLFWGGLGIPVYSVPKDVIRNYLCVQNIYNISSRKGRRIYHEIICKLVKSEKCIFSNCSIK